MKKMSKKTKKVSILLPLTYQRLCGKNSISKRDYFGNFSTIILIFLRE